MRRDSPDAATQPGISDSQPLNTAVERLVKELADIEKHEFDGSLSKPLDTSVERSELPLAEKRGSAASRRATGQITKLDTD
jgi:hypothetical protein